MKSWRQIIREKDKIIEDQQSQIDELKKKLKEIEKYLKAFDNAHTPSSKKLKKNTKKEEQEDEQNEEDKQKKPRFPGKPNNSKGGGINIPPPDDIKEHTLEISPISGLLLGKPIGSRYQIVIDFPDKPIQTIKHIIYQYKDPKTGEIVEPEVNLSKGIYGKNIQSVVGLLKNLTNSHEKIASLLRELGAPSFSSTTVQNISTMFILQLEGERNQIIKKIQNATYTHADETGLRKDGKKGYVWNICTNLNTVFLAAKGRARSNIIKLLRNFKGVLITDGYGAYDFYPLRQRCWAHLIREFKSYTKNNPEIHVQYIRLKKLYEQLKVLNDKSPPEISEKEIGKVKFELNDIVTCLKPINNARGLVTHIKNGGDDWFTALYYEGVPLDNNRAERELRPIVLLRKNIGCYRNWKGKRWIDVVISVLHTWKLQGKNLFEGLKKVAY